MAAGMRRNALFDAELGASCPEGLLDRASIHPFWIRRRVEADEQGFRPAVLASQDPLTNFEPAARVIGSFRRPSTLPAYAASV